VFQVLHTYLCENHTDVIHVWSQGSRDTIHYIYSSNRLPSVLIARTDTENSLNFNCSHFHSADASLESGSVRFTRSPDEVMVLIFTRVCQR